MTRKKHPSIKSITFTPETNMTDEARANTVARLARELAKKQHRSEPAARTTMHPRMAKTPEQIATLDTSGVVLRYRQLCAQVDRAVGLHNAVSKFSHAEQDATLKSLNELTALRDLFKAEANKRNAI